MITNAAAYVTYALTQRVRTSGRFLTALFLRLSESVTPIAAGRHMVREKTAATYRLGNCDTPQATSGTYI